jgi:ribosomal-protein-alanine N-acetyltransferase
MELKQGNIIIREMRYDDLSQVKYIRDESLDFLDTQVSFSLEETQHWFNTKNPLWYVIEIRDRVAGYIRTSNYDNVNKNLYIGLDLHPNFRGHGYAFQSYQMFMDWLKMSGYLTVLLKVQISNYVAYNLYRKLGFMPIGIIPNAVIKNNTQVDSVIMYKAL